MRGGAGQAISGPMQLRAGCAILDAMTPRKKRYTAEESKAFTEVFALKPSAKGPLNGLRFAVKDLIDVAGHKTSCGNPDWKRMHPPAAAHAVCVDQLLQAGARCVGKTVTDELAFSLIGENHFYGTPLNPKAPDNVPGGSSSGSASAVACGLADFALGTDTGGSVRVPASNCGIFGFRPTHGRVSVAGVNPLAPTFDTVGVLARSADILTKASAVLLGCDVPPNSSVGTIHLVSEGFALGDLSMHKAFAEPLTTLRKIQGASIQPTSLAAWDAQAGKKGLESWYDLYRAMFFAEVWSSLGSWVEEAKPVFGPRTRVSFDLAKNADRGVLKKLVPLREQRFEALRKFLRPGDLLCIPSAPSPAPLKGSLGNNRLSCPYYPRAGSLTAIAGIGRLPQVSLPVAEIDGLPLGLSLIAGHGQDAFLLGVAQAYAKHLGLAG